LALSLRDEAEIGERADQFQSSVFDAPKHCKTILVGRRVEISRRKLTVLKAGRNLQL